MREHLERSSFLVNIIQFISINGGIGQRARLAIFVLIARLPSLLLSSLTILASISRRIARPRPRSQPSSTAAAATPRAPRLPDSIHRAVLGVAGRGVRYAKFLLIQYFIDIDILQNSLIDIDIDILQKMSKYRLSDILNTPSCRPLSRDLSHRQLVSSPNHRSQAECKPYSSSLCHQHKF